MNTPAPFTVRVPARIDRQALRDALAAVGIDATAVSAIRFGPNSVEITALTSVPHPDGGPGQHRILIPIVDAPHEDPHPTVPHGMPTQPFSWLGTTTPAITSTNPPPTLQFPQPPAPA